MSQRELPYGSYRVTSENLLSEGFFTAANLTSLEGPPPSVPWREFILQETTLRMDDDHSAVRMGEDVTAPKTIHYEKFELTARPIPLASGKWTTEVRIRRNNVVRPFSAADEFNTEDEAIRHSLNLGRQIIDGEIPEFSGVDVLP